jgi:hypothetical protein
LQLLRVLLQVLHTAAEHTAAVVLHTAAEAEPAERAEVLRVLLQVLPDLRSAFHSRRRR